MTRELHAEEDGEAQTGAPASPRPVSQGLGGSVPGFPRSVAAHSSKGRLSEQRAKRFKGLGERTLVPAQHVLPVPYLEE